MNNRIRGVVVALALLTGLGLAAPANADEWGSFGTGFNTGAFVSGGVNVMMPSGMSNDTVGQASMTANSHYWATAGQSPDGSWRTDAFGTQSASGKGFGAAGFFGGAGGSAFGGTFNYNNFGYSNPPKPAPCCKG
jgi:hypothetical protein